MQSDVNWLNGKRSRSLSVREIRGGWWVGERVGVERKKATKEKTSMSKKKDHTQSHAQHELDRDKRACLLQQMCQWTGMKGEMGGGC